MPRVIPYQGYLENNGVAVNGMRRMVFKLYMDKTSCGQGGDAAWSATRENLPVYNGRFSVELGDTAAGDSAISDSLFRASAPALSVMIDDKLLSGCQVLRPVAFAQRSSGDVPIGTVIDWWRGNSSVDVPEGYQICDGSAVSNARSPMNGDNTPNLKGKFVRGVTSLGDIGTSGGSNEFPDYRGNATTSSHSDTHNHRWSYLDTGEDWHSYVENGSSLEMVAWGDGLDDGAGNGFFPIGLGSTSSSTRYYYTNNDTHSHSHTVTTTSSAIGVNAGANLPEYIGLLKLIRIY